MSDLARIAPELLVLVAAACALFAEYVPGQQRMAALFGAVGGSLAAVGAAVLPLGTAFGGMLVFDGPARFVRVLAAALVAVWCLWVFGRGIEGGEREAVALALFSTAGALFMASAAELMTLFLALEISTMPAYILVGYRRGDIRNLEGALKYFLMSLLTSLIALYGFSFVFGLAGTTYYAGFGGLARAEGLGLLAATLALVGMSAKLSAVPFHYWAPDAYEGASPITVAFVSTVPKLAGAIALVRLLGALAEGVPTLAFVVAALALLSMVLGNLAALNQTDLRRLMAYSGVAHTGYLLAGAVTLTAAAYSSSIFYAVAYSIPSMVVLLVAAEEGPLMESWAGLSSRRGPTAWAVVVALMSLVGVPPLIGFFGKLYVFSSAVSGGYAWLAAVGVLMSVVSAGYYLRIVRTMFFAPEPTPVVQVPRSMTASVAVGLLVAATIGLGIAAGPVLAWLGVFA